MKHNDPKISFCTVCMNRLHHLSKTLPQNISDNRTYPYVEFVIVDYNSSDGLYEWISTNFRKELSTGLVRYYRTNQPHYFNRSHSRNMAFKKASGDVLCNIDADNFTGPFFAQYIGEYFKSNPNAFLTPDYSVRDVMGRLCVKATDFAEVRGFNEHLEGYGYDDMDIYKRLEAKGLLHGFIDKHPEFLNAISHPNIERYQNEFLGKHIEKIYIAYLKPYLSEVIFFFNDGRYEKGRILDSELIKARKLFRGSEDNEISLLSGWQSGSWLLKEENYLLSGNTQKLMKMVKVAEGAINYRDRIFFEVSDRNVFDQLIINKSEIDNRRKCFFHESYVNRSSVNTEGYGQGELLELVPKI
ncbi:glycosyltransferase family 2 protein [Mucilaginibacter sp. Mucisp86]|uniref:glycosyltransferase family 2 protein n=1 Tax=Mucilaginibacter sp. Mucisp86 TaxID=3243060 RepID=UPI0039B3F23B